MLEVFCDWLSNTAVSAAFQTWTWFVPLVQTLHILGVGVVLISAFTVSLRLLEVTRSAQSLAVMTARTMPWTWAALTVLLGTGVLLTVTEPSRELLNAAFQAKMVLVLVLASTLMLHQRRVRQSPDYWVASSMRRLGARALGVTLLVVGTLIVIAGRWIAYV